jgi:methyltransferase family protein
MNFFDRFDRFYSTSQSAISDRLNKRHRVCIQRHEKLLRGKRVLDIASHDGLFSFAALQAGCSHVTGIEVRPHLVEAAKANFSLYGIEPSRYRFYLGDVLHTLHNEKIEVDVVLLLGFFYHTSRHAELASLISSTGAEHIILDTVILHDDIAQGRALVTLKQERADVEGFGFEEGPFALVGVPSRDAIKLIFQHNGFSTDEIDWTPYLKSPDGLWGYDVGTRATFLLSRKQPQ